MYSNREGHEARMHIADAKQDVRRAIAKLSSQRNVIRRRLLLTIEELDGCLQTIIMEQTQPTHHGWPLRTTLPLAALCPMKRENISNRLAVLRSARELTQSDVAVLMGLDVTTICKQENGDRSITSEQARKYAELFGCAILELYLDPNDIIVGNESDESA